MKFPILLTVKHLMVYAAIWASWLTSEVSHILYILSEKDCSRGEKLSKNETILAEANKCLYLVNGL